MLANAMKEPKVNPLTFNSAEKADQQEEKGVYFSEYEWYVFTEELKLGKSVETALHNARYCEKVNRGIKQLEEGRGQIHELIDVKDD